MARPIRTQQIDLVTGAVLVVCDMPLDRRAAPSTLTGAVLVDAGLLADLLPTIDPAVDTLVFVTAEDAGDIDAAAITQIARLAGRLGTAPGHVAAIRRVPAVNAAKQVSGGVVVEAVDREILNLLRSPEVIDREAITEALARRRPTTDGPVVNPTLLVASDGGKVLVVEDEDEDGDR